MTKGLAGLWLAKPALLANWRQIRILTGLPYLNRFPMNFRPPFQTREDRDAAKPKYESVVKYMVQANNLVTFSPDQSIYEVIDTIIAQKISGAPVLDEQKKLVGMISEKDCLRIIVDQAYHNMPLPFRTVKDYMTREVKTLSPDSDIVAAANEFLNTPIRRMPVVENGVLLGQVSRRDILRAARDISGAEWKR